MRGLASDNSRPSSIQQNNVTAVSQPNKLVIPEQVTNQEGAMNLVYFGQGYEQAKQDLWGLDQLRRHVKTVSKGKQSDIDELAAVFDFYELAE